MNAKAPDIQSTWDRLAMGPGGDEFSKLVHKTVDVHAALCYTGAASPDSNNIAAFIAAVV